MENELGKRILAAVQSHGVKSAVILYQLPDGGYQMTWTPLAFEILYFFHRLFGRAIDDAFDNANGKMKSFTESKLPNA